MKKLISAALVCALAAMLIAGCGQKQIDATTLATKLKSEGEYAENLNEVGENVAKKRYGLEDGKVTMCVSFKGTSAVVDEIAVIKATDADSVMKDMDEYKKSQIKSYQSYMPSEVPKLESAVLKSYGDTVVYCASKDADKAQNIINEYIEK